MNLERLLVIGTAVLNLTEKETRRKTMRQLLKMYKEYKILFGLEKEYMSPSDIIPEDVI